VCRKKKEAAKVRKKKATLKGSDGGASTSEDESHIGPTLVVGAKKTKTEE
jgi:hypothetical protein